MKGYPKYVVFFMSNEIHNKWMCACNMQLYFCELLKNIYETNPKKKKNSRGDEAS